MIDACLVVWWCEVCSTGACSAILQVAVVSFVKSANKHTSLLIPGLLNLDLDLDLN